MDLSIAGAKVAKFFNKTVIIRTKHLLSEEN
jgi:hypothetical protein